MGRPSRAVLETPDTVARKALERFAEKLPATISRDQRGEAILACAEALLFYVENQPRATWIPPPDGACWLCWVENSKENSVDISWFERLGAWVCQEHDADLFGSHNKEPLEVKP